MASPVSQSNFPSVMNLLFWGSISYICCRFTFGGACSSAWTFASSFHLRNIGKARCVLTGDATKTVMQSLVMSRLDYFNALLIGIQQDLIAKLQRLQNSAARIVSRTRKYEHITPVLIKLHWLPIKFRIQFKVLLLVYKALNGLAPKYIKELLVPYKPRRHLRSEAKGLLDEPRT